jgi:methylmalonyl-CoA mutase N-terminal domain/subunit
MSKERKPQFKTSSNIELKRSYSSSDWKLDGEKLGEAGKYPFTRGVQETMYRGRLCQRI